MIKKATPLDTETAKKTLKKLIDKALEGENTVAAVVIVSTNLERGQIFFHNIKSVGDLLLVQLELINQVMMAGKGHMRLLEGGKDDTR